MIYENGQLLAETERFAADEQMIVADIDLDRLVQERVRMTSFNDAALACRRGATCGCHSPCPIRRCRCGAASSDARSSRPIRRLATSAVGRPTTFKFRDWPHGSPAAASPRR
jgi:hypothetical protein